MKKKPRRDFAMIEKSQKLHDDGLSARQIAKVLSTKRRTILYSQVVRWLKYAKEM